MLLADNQLIKQIEFLSDIEKLQLVDLILMQLDHPDPEIDKVWSDEAKARWNAYQEGKLETVSLDQVMSKYRTP
jgi:putative addiction module component (TIGR02574 family)